MRPIDSPQIGPRPAEPKRAARLRFAAWTDETGRQLPPPFADLRLDPDVFEPTEGSFLIWKHLFRSSAGSGKRCLDVGCGSGILAIQLALNGAEHVHAIDIDREAVANTMANAIRNGVADRVDGKFEDVYTFAPDGQFDLIIASLYPMPVDPYRQVSGHRPADYWGRNLLDHLLAILPDMLAADGLAYVMQLSILSQRRTSEILEEAGPEAKVIDFDTFNFRPISLDHIEQIHRVEQLSDAYHLSLGQTEAMAAYLLAITRKQTDQSKHREIPTT
jgi:release factor glutamine methyltransferase